MIFDQVKNLNRYVSQEQFQKIERFMEKVSPDMQEGYYGIDGEKIYARVMCYQTSLREDCKIEAHNRYIDIQASLAGAEGIEVFDRRKLDILEAYNRENDVAFYQESVEPHVWVNNVPGYFSMIFPEEAHRPQISMDQGCKKVKKYVIKVQI
mgnify:CR=1 FL=1